MAGKSDIFDKTVDHYIKKIASLDFGPIAVNLGVKTDGETVTIPFFNTPYQVTRNAVLTPGGSPAPFGIGVVLCNYLIQCPDDIPRGDEWHSYRDFKDAAPLAGAFANTAERPIAENFSGRLSELEEAARILGGVEPAITFPYDLNLVIQALPRIPMLLLFNDADDEFPADCKLLFERRTESYLDMECVAILGMLLAEFLKRRGTAQSNRKPSK